MTSAIPNSSPAPVDHRLDHPRAPSLRLPPGSCDAHCHIFGPFDRYPLPHDRSFTPALASEPMLRRLHDRLGFARSVIVQSRGHGFDHRPLLDALRTGAGRYKGVALVRPTDGDAQIAAFDAAGVCGARVNFLAHLGDRPEPEAVRALAARIKPFGWHLALHVSRRDIVDYAAVIRSLDLPIVIDHMARPDLADGPDGAAMTALRKLLDGGRVWVKLSGADRLSATGAPFHDALPIARSLAVHAPERMLWGTDWPHVNLQAAIPDDGELVELIEHIVPDEASRRLLLVDNPVRLFGFG
jgi:predicted TIM-barrel fold metal-dependent hydrolase